jgi:class 3 adenylate cyclase
MSAATILFTDIVGFSKKPTSEQRRLVTALTDEVVGDLRSLLNPPLSTPSALALPTGDGLALAFLHDSRKQWDRDTLFNLIIRLHKWAHSETGARSSVKLRIGVHVGSVELVTDINGRPNVCGDTINFGQRVMDAANPQQTLFSETAYREYVGLERSEISATKANGRTISFAGPIEVYAKHRLQLLVYKATLEPSEPWWSNDDPVAQRLMVVSLTALPKLVDTISGTLEKATHLAFIQGTGERLLSKLLTEEVQFSPDLKRLWIFMPHPDAYDCLQVSAHAATPSFEAQSISNWKEYLLGLKQIRDLAEIKLGLFSEPPYFGASFVDWERPGGKIHVSPFVWGVPPPMCPGYDLEWVGRTPSPVYETYVEGLRHLEATSTYAFD